ncbi:hypothetical protein U1Q18_012448 [Sarracenia purpurea var. burkii]
MFKGQLGQEDLNYTYGVCCANIVFIPSLHNYRIWSYPSLSKITHQLYINGGYILFCYKLFRSGFPSSRTWFVVQTFVQFSWGYNCAQQIWKPSSPYNCADLWRFCCRLLSLVTISGFGDLSVLNGGLPNAICGNDKVLLRRMPSQLIIVAGWLVGLVWSHFSPAVCFCLPAVRFRLCFSSGLSDGGLVQGGGCWRNLLLNHSNRCPYGWCFVLWLVKTLGVLCGFILDIPYKKLRSAVESDAFVADYRSRRVSRENPRRVAIIDCGSRSSTVGWEATAAAE